MRKIDIPVVTVGPGTQPAESDGAELEAFSPGEMSTFAVPDLPEPEEIRSRTAARALLDDLLALMESYDASKDNLTVDVTELGPDDKEIINQVLGEGEVGVRFDDSMRVHIQEAVLTGMWRVQYLDHTGKLIHDAIEVGPIPSLVTEATFKNTAVQLPDAEQLPQGVMNAAPLIGELNDKIAEYQDGDEAHVINLTLLPQSDEDLEYLQTTLGQGRVLILSRGYGNCRITSTNTQNVWWVQYFNSQDKLILNTIEVSSVPDVACASIEDIQDSTERLKEIIEIYA